MGKITRALKKAAEERMKRIDKVVKIQERDKLIIKKMKDSDVDARLVTYFDPKSVISEQYKILTTNLMALNKGKPPKVMSVTSSIHAEGKTVTTLNLAITLAQQVKKPKVLLIDADMRKGRLCDYLGVKTKTDGLSEVLSGKADFNDCLFNIDIENLTFMSSGEVPDNPAELLQSEATKELLAQLKPRFDYILIDTPPIIPVTDPGIIGSITEGVIMIIQAGRTQRGIVRRAQQLLEQSHAKVIGHVLTNIEYYLPEYIYRYL